MRRAARSRPSQWNAGNELLATANQHHAVEAVRRRLTLDCGVNTRSSRFSRLAPDLFWRGLTGHTQTARAANESLLGLSPGGNAPRVQ